METWYLKQLQAKSLVAFAHLAEVFYLTLLLLALLLLLFQK